MLIIKLPMGEDLDARVCSWCLLARQSPSLKRKETRKKQWGRKRTIAEEEKNPTSIK
jgi:hypothetical protein